MPEVKMESIGKSTKYEMVLDAPRAFVWNMRFGEDYALKPLRRGYRIKSYSVDYEEGGVIAATMVNDEGDSYRNEGRFIKIEPGKKLEWELASECIPGLRIRFDERFEDQGEGTMYTTNVIFENAELLSNVAELGCEKVFAQYLEHFGDFVNRMVRTEKVVE